MVKVKVKSRSSRVKSFEATFKGQADAVTLSQLKQQIQSTAKLSLARQRVTTADKKVLDDGDKSLAELGLQDGDEVLLKDLGPQISWRTVFLTEYFGPLWIHPILFLDTPVSRALYGTAYGASVPIVHSQVQRIAFAMVMLHYLKRELETVFVHRFSNATMPAFNIFKNSFHYWILSGALIAVPIYGPAYGAKALKGTLRSTDEYIWPLVALWLFGEVSNLVTHLNLRSLRPPGTRTRAIPQGYGFSLVACPNYFFEAVGWAAFALLTLSPAALLFLVVSAGQMAVWAKKKQRNYKKEFGNKWPRNRTAMVPLIF